MGLISDELSLRRFVSFVYDSTSPVFVDDQRHTVRYHNA